MTDFDEESNNGKLLNKMKENPFMPVGIAGFLAVLGYGAYQYKNRGKMSTSVYLMQLRVMSQGTVVGVLAVGVAFMIVRDQIYPKLYPKK